MTPPIPTPVYRLMHIDNLTTCLARAGLYAPNHVPNDGRAYRTIHNESIQAERHQRLVRCGPKGVIHDYVAFYFGVLSPMLLQLKTGQVPDYNEGQEPLIYLVTTAQAVADAGGRFVFSDGQGIAAYTDWFDDFADLTKVDWATVGLQYWYSTVDDGDRQRRKQAEFLVHRTCPWAAIQHIAVLNEATKQRADAILTGVDPALRKPVVVRRNWYYP